MEKKFYLIILGIILLIGLILVVVAQPQEDLNESNIFGYWKAEVPHSHGNSVHKEENTYEFLEDGTFIYIESYHGEKTKTKGKFSVSDGKLFLKEMTSNGVPNEESNKTVEYQLGSDMLGKYLKIDGVEFRKES